MLNAVFIWSGGKDSALALNRVLKDQKYHIKYLVTTFSAATERVSMHGVRKTLIEMQAKSIGIPLWPVYIPDDLTLGTYESQMQATYLQLKKEGIAIAIFGDIFLKDLKIYRQQQLALVDLSAYFPLWGESTAELVMECINLDFEAVLICVNATRLGHSFLGQKLDQQLVSFLPKEVDPAGENGEYHTFVYAGPIFKSRVAFQPGKESYIDLAANKGTTASNYDSIFFYLDLIPVNSKK